MEKKLATSYSTQLLVSITTGIAVIAGTIARSLAEILLILVGALLGTFVLDLEYLLYAYFFEPQKDFSVNLKAYIKHKDFIGAIKYIKQHPDDIKDKSLNSALFQLVMIPLLIYISYATTNYFVKALAFSTYANSIYRMVESYYLQKSAEWFWALKNKPDKRGLIAYSIILILVLIFCLSVL